MKEAVTILGLGDGSDFSDDGATAGSANIGVENKEIASVMEYTPAAWGCVFSPCNGAYREERGGLLCEK